MSLKDSVAPKTEPVVNPSDMTRYKALLLAKRDELRAAGGKARVSYFPPTTLRATWWTGPAQTREPSCGIADRSPTLT